MTFRIDAVTLFPEMFPGPLAHSLAGKALQDGVWSLATTPIRQFGVGRHRQVDDTPAGGGAGLVMRADVLAAAIDRASPPGDPRPRLLMSPRGRPLDQRFVRELAGGPGMTIVCGRFEGVDERIVAARHLVEVSLGDFVLSGGEPAALALIDAVVRLLPGVMGNPASAQTESFSGDGLEFPQYTRPPVFEGASIPAILLSGDHGAVQRWREAEQRRITLARRPDLAPPDLAPKDKK